MGEAKRRKKLDPNYGTGGVTPRAKPEITEEIIYYGSSIQLKHLPLTIESLVDYDLTIIDCDFSLIRPEIMRINFQRIRDEAMGFCKKSHSYGRKTYLNQLMSNKETLERFKNELGNRLGVLFISDDYERSELWTLYWVTILDCERSVKWALGDHVGSWIADLVKESAKRASIKNFPILTYSPISQINEEAPASFFLADLTDESRDTQPKF